MKYKHIVQGIFKSRPNRFIAHVEINGVEEVCHVKNTGRCREILVPGCRVWLEKSDNPNRKTAYDLVAAEKLTGESTSTFTQIINIDSQAPNIVTGEWLRAGGFISNLSLIKPEKVYGDSRVDFYMETEDGRKIYMEVKGVTLETDGVASFPDAPTERGVKHLHELMKAVDDGYEAMILFVIQMKHISYMKANEVTHPEFADALKMACEHGVKVMAYDCVVTEDSLVIDQAVEVRV